MWAWVFFNAHEWGCGDGGHGSRAVDDGHSKNVWGLRCNGRGDDRRSKREKLIRCSVRGTRENSVDVGVVGRSA